MTVTEISVNGRHCPDYRGPDQAPRRGRKEKQVTRAMADAIFEEADANVPVERSAT